MSKYLVNRFRNVTVALNTPFDSRGAVSPDASWAPTAESAERTPRCLSCI